MSICRNQLCGGILQSKRSMAFLETLHISVKRSGIATECCENRCSYSYLKTYCCNT
ncbi:unnamed protein product [Nippostrongylus brasiliensis]|uniref:Insulin-like peptide (inferred by orthology to a C. elegans protein) n=1 Tax=Nippostrongylus brasiliensis TaxID=27835 RepID=A0A0N4XV16_NIPBR|nr:unnamed protein product [Nippostrongylus brasiliensis]